MTTSPTLLQTMKVRPRTYFPFRSTRHALTGDSFSIGIIYTIPSRPTTIQPLNLGTDPAQCLHLLSPLIRTIKERRDGSQVYAAHEKEFRLSARGTEKVCRLTFP